MNGQAEYVPSSSSGNLGSIWALSCTQLTRRAANRESASSQHLYSICYCCESLLVPEAELWVVLSCTASAWILSRRNLRVLLFSAQHVKLAFSTRVGF